MSEQVSSRDQLIEKINELAKRLFALLREQSQLKNSYQAKEEERKQTFEASNTPLEQDIAAIKRELRSLVFANRSSLLIAGKKSFVTLVAILAFRWSSGSFAITDKTKAYDIARRLGVLRKVSTIKVKFTINSSKLEAYLRSHPEHAEDFADVVKRTEAGDSLTIQPNSPYLVDYDGKRLTPPSISLSSD